MTIPKGFIQQTTVEPSTKDWSIPKPNHSDGGFAVLLLLVIIGGAIVGGGGSDWC